MEKKVDAWKTILVWGLAIIGVNTVGAYAGERYSGTCMFILIPYFTSLAAVMPAVKVKRFGAITGAFIPYFALGFIPLYYYDWLQQRSLVGLWAVFAFSASGLLIGLFADLACLAARRLREGARMATTGAVVQIVTFITMLVGLKYLYLNSAVAVGHLHFFDKEWFFTLPWLALNGAFGGYTAYALGGRARGATATAGELNR
jgi:hypothetical protein